MRINSAQFVNGVGRLTHVAPFFVCRVRHSKGRKTTSCVASRRLWVGVVMIYAIMRGRRSWKACESMWRNVIYSNFVKYKFELFLVQTPTRVLCIVSTGNWVINSRENVAQLQSCERDETSNEADTFHKILISLLRIWKSSLWKLLCSYQSRWPRKCCDF